MFASLLLGTVSLLLSLIIVDVVVMVTERLGIPGVAVGVTLGVPLGVILIFDVDVERRFLEPVIGDLQD